MCVFLFAQSALWVPVWIEMARSSHRSAWCRHRGAHAHEPAGTVHGVALGGPTSQSHWGETQHRYWPVWKKREAGKGREEKSEALAAWPASSRTKRREMKKRRQVKASAITTAKQSSKITKSNVQFSVFRHNRIKLEASVSVWLGGWCFCGFCVFTRQTFVVKKLRLRGNKRGLSCTCTKRCNAPEWHVKTKISDLYWKHLKTHLSADNIRKLSASGHKRASSELFSR